MQINTSAAPGWQATGEGDPRDEAVAHLWNAEGSLKAGDRGRALLLFDQGIALLGKLKLVREQASALVSKGLALDRLGEHETARDVYEQADHLVTPSAAWARQYCDGAEQEAALENSARLALYARAIAHYTHLVDQGGQPQLYGDLAKALIAKAVCLEKDGENEAAHHACAQAIAILEPLVVGQKRIGLKPALARAQELRTALENSQ